MTAQYCFLDLPTVFGALGAYAFLNNYVSLPLHTTECEYAQSLSLRRFREYQAGRSLARQLLVSKRPDSVENDWCVTASNGRRPCVLFRGELLVGMSVSITHTKELVAVVVSDQCQVGIDAEPMTRSIKETIWPQVFSPAEQNYLGDLEPDEVQMRARELWCLKESMSKAAGMGMAVSFSDVGFSRYDGIWRIEGLPVGEAFKGRWLAPYLARQAEYLFAVSGYS
mgnify:CR=1 FL=1